MMRKINLIASSLASCGIYASLAMPLMSYANDASRNQEIAERFEVNSRGSKGMYASNLQQL